MSIITVEQLYEQHIKPRPVAEQLRLVAIITQRLKLALRSASIHPVEGAEHSLLELEELEVELWKGVDIQKYVDEFHGEQKGSPHAVLRLAGTMLPEEAEAILQAAQECRRIDWEL